MWGRGHSGSVLFLLMEIAVIPDPIHPPAKSAIPRSATAGSREKDVVLLFVIGFLLFSDLHYVYREI